MRSLVIQYYYVKFGCSKFCCIVLVKQWCSLPNGNLARPFQYGVMSDGSCVNGSTLDQTYWFLSVGTWISELCASAAEWLLFHHLIDISSLLYFYFLPSKLLQPTALLRSNYAMDVYHFPLMKLSMCQGSFRIKRCYIYTVDGSSTFSFAAVPMSSELFL